MNGPQGVFPVNLILFIFFPVMVIEFRMHSCNILMHGYKHHHTWCLFNIDFHDELDENNTHLHITLYCNAL